MFIRHIAHSGFYLESEGFGLMIDPWFHGSDMKTPIVKGLMPGFDTIDFQIHSNLERIENYRPQVILLSHLSPAHAPKSEIIKLIQQQKSRVQLAYPSLAEEMDSVFRGQFADFDGRVTLMPTNHAQVIEVGPFRITAYGHTMPNYRAWFVQCVDGSFFHLADGAINTDIWNRRMDNAWADIQNLSPNLMVVTAGGNLLKAYNGSDPYIIENATLSPTEAARIATWVKPGAVALMGLDHYSLWHNSILFQLPSDIANEQFYWAMTHLNPKVKVYQLRPGVQFETGETNLTRHHVNLI